MTVTEASALQEDIGLHLVVFAPSTADTPFMVSKPYTAITIFYLHGALGVGNCFFVYYLWKG